MSEENVKVGQASAPEAAETKVPVEEAIPATDPALQEKGLLCDGKLIIAEGTREVNGTSHRHLKLADGTEVDVTEEKWAEINA